MAKDRYSELLALISSGKANTSQKMEFSNLLKFQTEEEHKQQFEAKIEKVKAFILEQGLSFKDVIDNIKGPAEPIFRWVDGKGLEHTRYDGERGKFPAWVESLKKELTEEKALECVVSNSEKGKAFVKKVYKPK